MTAQNELDAKARGGTELLGERLEKLINPELLKNFQIIRSRFRGFDTTKSFHIFWEHDLAGDPESKHVFNNKEIMDGFDLFVFVSYWQKNAFFAAFPNIPKEKCVVIRNAIDPIDMMERGKIDDKVRLVYTPTPHRGLELLVPVFEALCNDFPGKLHLDVYSSFKLYGWEERDKPYQQLFDKINVHPDMTYHGTVSNDEIRKALLRSDIFAYPSIWEETSCLCLIEAMSAGCDCVCSDLAAIPETSGGLIPMYPYTGNLNLDSLSFYQILKEMIHLRIQDVSIRENLLKINKFYTDHLHSTVRMKETWNAVLTNLEARGTNK